MASLDAGSLMAPLMAPCSHTLSGYIFNFLNVGVKREGR